MYFILGMQSDTIITAANAEKNDLFLIKPLLKWLYVVGNCTVLTFFSGLCCRHWPLTQTAFCFNINIHNKRFSSLYYWVSLTIHLIVAYRICIASKHNVVYGYAVFDVLCPIKSYDHEQLLYMNFFHETLCTCSLIFNKGELGFDIIHATSFSL